jgi:hypothetical protein
VPEKLLVEHSTMIRNGNLCCQKDWNELVEAIELTDEMINHVHWEDVELWIQQQMDDNRRSELAMNVRDEYITNQERFDGEANRLQLCYVE